MSFDSITVLVAREYQREEAANELRYSSAWEAFLLGEETFEEKFRTFLQGTAVTRESAEMEMYQMSTESCPPRARGPPDGKCYDESKDVSSSPDVTPLTFC